MTITLKTLGQATKQEVFDQVAAHLLRQKMMSINRFGGCAYRGVFGLKCSMGCLMSDEEYHPDFEGLTWAELSAKFPIRVPELTAEMNRFLAGLQRIHDIDPVSQWKEKLIRYAKRWELDTSQVKGDNRA